MDRATRISVANHLVLPPIKPDLKRIMIISASRRTDIPAYYGTWFMNRLKSGYLLVPNPMNRKQVSRITLDPKTIECIVFWTKNPEPFLPALPMLDTLGYRYYFLYTVTPYGPEIEPAVPTLPKRLDTFRKLSDLIGPERTIWRYDPIIISRNHPADLHINDFAAIAKALSQKTNRCIVSFVRFYRKCQMALQQLGAREPQEQETKLLLRELRSIASNHAIALSGCCLPESLDMLLSDKRGCIDPQLIAALTENVIPFTKDRNQRAECRCTSSIDIGQYHCCPHLCRYCYANSSGAAVRKNFDSHDSDAPMLYGTLQGDEQIITRKTSGNSRVSPQLKLF